MNPGDAVTLLVDVVPWYSGYGANASVVIPAGTVGVVQSVGVPAVRGRHDYNVFRFEHEGETWQASATVRDTSRMVQA